MKTTILYLTLFLVPNLLLAQERSFLPEQFIQEGDTLNYRILYPEGYSEENEYPLVLFLHGAGERGSDNQKQLVHGSELFLQNTEFPAIVLFPQCPTEDYWSNVKTVTSENGKRRFSFRADGEPTQALSLVMALLDDFLASGKVKKDQVYLGGLSMGGMGSFELLRRRPDTFAAAIPICGGGNPATVSGFAPNTELWIFHGTKDDIVPPIHSLEMFQAVNAAGGIANLTIYGSANHNSWDSAFAEPELLEWLFSKKLNPQTK